MSDHDDQRPRCRPNGSAMSECGDRTAKLTDAERARLYRRRKKKCGDIVIKMVLPRRALRARLYAERRLRGNADDEAIRIAYQRRALDDLEKSVTRDAPSGANQFSPFPKPTS